MSGSKVINIDSLADRRVGQPPGGAAAASWGDQQLAHAQSIDDSIDSVPFFSDLGYDQGENLATGQISFQLYTFANGTTTLDLARSSGVAVCNPNGPPDDNLAWVLGAYPIKDMVSDSWYMCARTWAQTTPTAADTQRVLVGSIQTDFVFYALLTENQGAFLLQLFANNGNPSIVLVSPQPVDLTAPHDYAVIFSRRGGFIQAYEDRLPIPGLFTTDLSQLLTTNAGNSLGAGAFGNSAAPTLVDKIGYFVPSLHA